MKNNDGSPKIKICTLEQTWDSYAKDVLGAGVSHDSVQYDETQKAFYAGAATVYCQMCLTSDSEEASLKYLDSLNKSIMEFQRSMELRLAKLRAESN